jgi:hypothetical protein
MMAGLVHPEPQLKLQNGLEVMAAIINGCEEARQQADTWVPHVLMTGSLPD